MATKLKKSVSAMTILVFAALPVVLATCSVVPEGVNIGTPSNTIDTGTTINGWKRPAYVLPDRTNPDLTIKFGKRASASVPLEQWMIRDTFADLHKLISTPIAGDDFTTIIEVGNYIDLIGLTVARYHTGTEAPDADGDLDTGPENGAISLTTGSTGLHLVVVGINSFKRDGTGAAGTTNGINPSGTTPGHVVFQFQDIPGTHRMNPTADNTNGYGGSEMRQYLVPTGVTGSGKFLTGLLNATGLNATTMLWAPKREVADGGVGASGPETIEDKLWLPTVWEIFGNDQSSVLYENIGNQALLGSSVSGTCWLASPNDGSMSNFCNVDSGSCDNSSADAVKGFVPAFCVR